MKYGVTRKFFQELFTEAGQGAKIGRVLRSVSIVLVSRKVNFFYVVYLCLAVLLVF